MMVCLFLIIGINYRSTNNTKLLKHIYNLSTKRAKAVFDFLIENNIPKELMEFKGEGNSRLLYPFTEIESELRKNMRVELIVSYKKSLKI
jgi:flagellar motor protein MotB